MTGIRRELRTWSPAPGLGTTTCAVMTPDRDLTTTDRALTAATQDYLRQCIDIAAAVGSPVVGGPIYAPVARLWQLDPDERRRTIERLVEALRSVADHAGRQGVRLALEPLNRYETSLINTVEQAMDVVAGVDSPALGVLLDTFHLNIEEKDPAAATRMAAGHIAHVQACGTDRGTPGADRFEWDRFADALAEASYAGPICIESFTAHNAAIARAASIWRPLAATQDALASTGWRSCGRCSRASAEADPDEQARADRGRTVPWTRRPRASRRLVAAPALPRGGAGPRGRGPHRRLGCR